MWIKKPMVWSAWSSTHGRCRLGVVWGRECCRINPSQIVSNWRHGCGSGSAYVCNAVVQLTSHVLCDMSPCHGNAALFCSGELTDSGIIADAGSTDNKPTDLSEKQSAEYRYWIWCHRHFVSNWECRQQYSASECATELGEATLHDLPSVSGRKDSEEW